MKTDRVACSVALALSALVMSVNGAEPVPPAQSNATPNATPPADPPKPEVKDDEITFVASGFPVTGYPVLPCDDKDFKIKLRDTGDIMTFHWDSLVDAKSGDDTERRRVQKLYGLEIQNGHKHWVGEEKLNGVRLHLGSNKTLDVLPLPDQNRPVQGLLAFKTAGAKLMFIHEAEIKSKEPIEAFESDFYTPQEIFERWMLEKPPGSDDAQAHLEIAKKCANMELFREALNQLKMAEIIDPRTEERNKDMRIAIIKADADKQTQDLLQKMLQRCLAEDWFGALDYLDKLDRNFPNSEYKSRWDAKRADIEKGTKKEFNKQVVYRCYGVAMDLIQSEVFKKIKVDKKGNPVPSIPGKQVTTKAGDIFRGTLAAPDDAASAAGGALAMKVGDMNLSISQKDVLSITDVDLSEGVGEVHPTYDDVKDFIINLKDPAGLKMSMIKKIAKNLKHPDKEVQDIFDHRLEMKAVYEDGHLSREDRYVTIHDAKWGRGSWLRDGSKPLPLLPNGDDPNAPGGGGGAGDKGNKGGNRKQNQNQKDQQMAAQEQKDDPELSDDPNIWWAAQTVDTQYNILLAMAAEKVFKAINVNPETCTECMGKGTVVLSGAGGRPITYRCQKCRGVVGPKPENGSVLFNIQYH